MKMNALPSARFALLVGAVALTACGAGSGTTAAKANRSGPCSAGEASCNVISGYAGNSAAEGVTTATIAGGGMPGFPNEVSASFGTVGGGEGNVAGEDSTVAGGSGNVATQLRAAVGGGTANRAAGEGATVSGGFKNSAVDSFAAVGGGSLNAASAYYATVGGGSGNMANYQFTTVSGGTENLASNVASVVAGGEHNLAEGAFSSVGGGLNNSAGGYLAVVPGGAGNQAIGSYSMIPGGFANTAAGAYSLAAGRLARVSAEHPGAFLFADSNPFAFHSAAPNEFALRATGGVRMVTGIDQAGNALAGVRLSPGSGSWESLSDVNSKAGLAPVDGQNILQRLLSVPISTWYYRAQGPSITHIGPMAQDFYGAFKFGQDNRYISTVDEEGVALAAIQELYRMVQQQSPSSQQQRIDALEQRLALSNGMTALAFVLAAAALWRRSPSAHQGLR